MAMVRAGHPTRSVLNLETQLCNFGQKGGPAQIQQQQQQQQMPWMVPTFAAIHVLAFILVMSHNNCNMKANIIGNNACLFSILKRFSFQPLKENPSLGPSASILLEFGALESELVTKAGEGWRLVTTILLHAGVFHLAVNLVGLCYIGLRLEKEFGAFKVMFNYENEWLQPKDNALHGQKISTILNSTVNINGRDLYDHLKSMRIFTLTMNNRIYL
jgi:hypothetical protein